MNEKPPPTESREYDGERDMDRFWKAAQLEREPVKQKWYVPSLIVLVVISIPWYRAEGDTSGAVLGLPAWIWVPLLCTLGISALTTLVALRYWKHSDSDED